MESSRKNNMEKMLTINQTDPNNKDYNNKGYSSNFPMKILMRLKGKFLWDTNRGSNWDNNYL